MLKRQKGVLKRKRGAIRIQKAQKSNPAHEGSNPGHTSKQRRTSLPPQQKGDARLHFPEDSPLETHVSSHAPSLPEESETHVSKSPSAKSSVFHAKQLQSFTYK